MNLTSLRIAAIPTVALVAALASGLRAARKQETRDGWGG
jgi:hypothetical protein